MPDDAHFACQMSCLLQREDGRAEGSVDANCNMTRASSHSYSNDVLEEDRVGDSSSTDSTLGPIGYFPSGKGGSDGEVFWNVGGIELFEERLSGQP